MDAEGLRRSSESWGMRYKNMTMQKCVLIARYHISMHQEWMKDDGNIDPNLLHCLE